MDLRIYSLLPPPAEAAPGNLSEMQIIRHHPDLLIQKLGVGSTICVLISLPGDSDGPIASDQSSSFLGAWEEINVWTKLRFVGTVNPKALEPLGLSSQHRPEVGKEGSEPESWRLLAVQRGPPKVATKPQPSQWAVRNGRSHVLSVSNPSYPGESLEVSPGPKGLKRLTWRTLSQKHGELISTTVQFH